MLICYRGETFWSPANITYHRSLWGCNTKTLRHDTSVVGGARAVPQQLAIVKLLERTEPLVLSLTNNFEDLQRDKWIYFDAEQ